MFPASQDGTVVVAAVVDGEADRRQGGGNEDVVEIVGEGMDGLVEGVELGIRSMLIG